MSQIGRSLQGSGAAVVETLTADNAVAVPPNGSFTIFVVGGANVTAPSVINMHTVGDAGTNTLTVNLNDSISLPNTNALGTTGLYSLGGQPFLHNAGNVTNTFVGRNAGNLSVTGIGNTCAGETSGQALTSGFNNSLYGQGSGVLIQTGINNVAVGVNSLGSLVSGNSNVCLGTSSGANYTAAEGGNICISNSGTLGDNATIRIGSTHVKNYQAGIYNVTLAAPEGVVVVDANGQLGMADDPGLFKWVEIFADQSAAVGTGYVANGGALITVTLPATFDLGDIIAVVGKGAGLFKIVPAAGDTIVYVSASGLTSVTAQERYDAIELVAIEDNATWLVRSSTGNYVIA